MIIIDVIETEQDRRDFYGITHVSATVHDVTGPGVHNRHHPHKVQVWDNATRPRDETSESMKYHPQQHLRHLPGKYIDPNGRPTDDMVTFLLSAESVVISNPPTIVRYGTALAIGDEVRLRFPDGILSVPMTVTARSLRDPELVRTTEEKLTHE